MLTPQLRARRATAGLVIALLSVLVLPAPAFSQNNDGRPQDGLSGATVTPNTTAESPVLPPTPTAPAPEPGQAATERLAGPTSEAQEVGSISELVASGGAEMGQRSRRVAGSDSLEPSRASITSEGTWMPTFGVQGLDVSSHQPDVRWQEQWNMGARFAYVKASEGNYYVNEQYGAQYQGARAVGMLRGAYHFAIPNWSSGADQARYFVANGGGWTADGYTLPPVLDFEFNPYPGRTINGFYFGNTCYDMTPAQLGSWVRDFGTTMKSLTGRLPVIYTNTSWWNQCLGNPAGFSDYPLWVAAYPDSPTNNAGPVPTASWNTYSIWQYSSTGPLAGDSNVWNGDYAGLKAFASSGVPPRAQTEIAAAQSRNPALGSPTGPITCGLRSGGCYQAFQNGAVLWSPEVAAQVSLFGAIRNRWAAEGFENGALGYPTSGMTCGLKDGGCYQSFQGGAIIWSPASGAQVSLYGAVRDRWASERFENGPMGYPTSGLICGLKNGGCYQWFQGGVIIWSASTGAQISAYGPLRDRWAAENFENGVLGYPTGPVSCNLKNSGCFQSFQGGAVVWSSGSGAQVSKFGGIRSRWGSEGYENGFLGYPTTSEMCGLLAGGCYQMFQGGAILWSPQTGAQTSKYGGIRTRWGASGYERGALGYPVMGEQCGLRADGCYQMFQGGAIVWSNQTGAHVSPSGAIRSTWGNLGFENGRLGYPTSSETCTSTVSSCSQTFQYGRIDWSSTAGVSVTP